MNKNVMIVLGGGFMIAILVAVLVQASLNGSKKKAPVVESKTEILVAARDLTVGRDLKSADLKWQSWPEGDIFIGAVMREEGQSIEDVGLGKLAQPYAEGQPLHISSIIKEDKGNFLAARLGKGMRAVGISVKAHTIAGGFIGPGDFVDVIVTYKVTVRDRENPLIQSMVSSFASETILENVRVVAVDQKSVREEDEAKIGRTVTLEVDAQGAEKLALATEMGDITLSMRGIGDKEISNSKDMTTDVSMSRVLTNMAIAQGGGPAGNVRIYNGNVTEEVQTRQPMLLDAEGNIEVPQAPVSDDIIINGDNNE